MVPKSVGTYRLIRKIGEGGMGEVYEGFDDRIKRHAAIKLLHPEHAANARTVERLHSEATAVNIIRHPSVVEIYDFGRLKDGTTYLVMEYLEGETLAGRLQMRATPMSAAEVLPIAAQLASALDAAHQHGSMHKTQTAAPSYRPQLCGGPYARRWRVCCAAQTCQHAAAAMEFLLRRRRLLRALVCSRAAPDSDALLAASLALSERTSLLANAHSLG